MRNPAAPNQKFEALEVWGLINKGKYRIRLIYYNSLGSDCLLMGEEMLEYAKI